MVELGQLPERAPEQVEKDSNSPEVLRNVSYSDRRHLDLERRG